MSTDRELDFPCEQFDGVDQEVDRENIGNYNQWQTQNLWEKKINILETRGGSVLLASGWPNNIGGVDNLQRIFKNTLDHKRVVCLHGVEETPTTLTTTQPVILQWGTGGTDPAGNLVTWNLAVNANVGFTPYKLILRYVGYGFDKLDTVTWTPSTMLGFTGGSGGIGQVLEVIVTGALTDPNITAIEVYAIVACGGATYNSNVSAIWVGSVDLITNPVGTFKFYHAPLSKISSSSSSSGSNGSIACQYTISGTNFSGGALIPGKTYYVAVLPHYFAWSATAASCQNAYRQAGFDGGLSQYNVLSIQLQPGQNAINVNYPQSSASPISFNSMLIAVGENPQLLIPYQLSNTNPGSPNGQLIACVSSFPINTPAVVDIEWLSSGAANLRFRQSDFSTGDCLSRINNDGITVPVFISRQSAVNRYDNGSFAAITVNVNTLTGGGTTPPLTVSPNLASAPFYTDPIPAGTPVVFGGSSAPGNISFGTVYYWLAYGNTSAVALTPGGTPITWTSNGTSVTMTFTPSAAYGEAFYEAVVSGSFFPIYTGSYYLPQPLSAQTYSMTQYQDLCFFVSGISNNPALAGAGGFPNLPISGSNYYVTDGNVAALVVTDYSTNPVALPSATVIGLYQESILLSGGPECGDTTTFSLATNPFGFQLASLPGINQFFEVEGLGEWVTGFSVFAYSLMYVTPQSFLVITKKNSTWILENLPVFSIATPTFLIQVSKTVGTPSGLSLTQSPVGVLFAHTENVYMVKGGGDPVPIGDPISYILKQSDLSRAVGVYHDEQFKLSFYCPLYAGTVGYNNVEFWLDIKKMKQSQGKPDWKGPMIGRSVDYCEVENLTGDGVVYNLTRNRTCVDRLNQVVYTADVIPAESATQVFDFSTPVTSLMETKDYRVKEADNDWNKLFTRTLWKVRTNCVSGSPLAATVVSWVEGVQQDSKTVNFSGLAAVNFDDQPQVYTMEFPTSRYRGRTIRKIFSTTQRVGIGGFRLYYQPERRRIGS
jgi:hypothetical protein